MSEQQHVLAVLALCGAGFLQSRVVGGAGGESFDISLSVSIHVHNWIAQQGTPSIPGFPSRYLVVAVGCGHQRKT